MSREIEALRSELAILTERDFDLTNTDATGIERLGEICDELAEHSVEYVAPLILGFIERFADPELIDASWDLGSPGPLVHTLEAMPGYEPYLEESLRRCPAPLSVWMLNRILNALRPGEIYDRYVDLLRSIRDREDVSVATASDAADFLEHQAAARRA